MTEKRYHCLYAGLLDNKPIECNYPGLECVDANCNGYDKCKQYQEGSRVDETN